MTETRHLSVFIDRSAADVYDYARDPTHLPEWAPGLGTSIERIDGEWVVGTPEGGVIVRFAPRNEFGVLDHDVVLPSGETFSNPLRVTADGSGSEIVFALRRQAGMTDAEYDRDSAAVLADLRSLKRILELR